MRTSRTREVIVVAVLASGAACSAPAGVAKSDERSLIGGSPAATDDLPSVVYLKTGCTAAKVAPARLLTAAHCVLSTVTHDVRWAPGDFVGIARVPSEGFTDYPVKSATPHPAWKEACAKAFCALSSVTVRLDAPDVAIIELARDIDGIPSTPIDAAPLAEGDDVLVLGYGCTDGVRVTDPRQEHSLKSAHTRVIPAASAVHDGSALTSASAPVAAGNYAMTPGPALDPSMAGLCPGDSGGPLLRDGRIVGVNANYTFRNEDTDSQGIPVTNWHTRLDGKSRHDVASWLTAQGALTR